MHKNKNKTKQEQERLILNRSLKVNPLSPSVPKSSVVVGAVVCDVSGLVSDSVTGSVPTEVIMEDFEYGLTLHFRQHLTSRV